MKGEPGCEFCEIAVGVAPATKVFEDELTLAFFPLKPAALGHTLVVPKPHVANFLELTDTVGAAVIHTVVLVGQALSVALQPEGMNCITSAGEAATQSVFHLHFHIVPRWRDDKIGPIWPPSQPLDDAVEDALADRVREALVGL